MVRLGIGIGKTRADRAVPSAAEKAPRLKSKNLLTGYKTKAVGVDVTRVEALSGMGKNIDKPPAENAEQLKAWLKPRLTRV